MSALESVRTVLLDLYARTGVRGFESWPPSGSSVAWSPLDTRLQPATAGAAAAVADPVAGVVLVVLPFGSGALQHQVDQVAPWVAELGQALVVHWMVEASELTAWIERVDDVTGAVVDAVVRAPDQTWEQAARTHGFPRLLLAAREVLALRTAAAVDAWTSADARVRAALRSLPGRLRDPEVRRLADEVVADLPSPPATAEPPPAPMATRRLEVHGFRNLDSLALELATDPPAPVVIWGPNGAGKSNLVEALQLALCGTSDRYLAYRGDTRDSGRSGTRYLERYVAPLDGSGAQPEVHLDERVLPIGPPGHDDDHVEALSSLGSTVRTQDGGARLLHRHPAELAAEVVGSQSALARTLLDRLGDRVAKADLERKALLRSHGLNTSITKSETVRERVAAARIVEASPDATALIRWLDRRVFRRFSGLSHLGELAERLRDVAARGAALANELGAEPDAVEAVRDHLTRSAGAGQQVAAVLGDVAERVDAWHDGLEADLAAWSAWIRDPRRAAPTEDLRALNEQLAGLQEEQARITGEGKAVARHLEHLADVLAFVEGAGDAHHCPSCGTEHPAGVRPVVQALRGELSGRREELANRYREVSGRLKRIREALAAKGASTDPLTPARREQAEAALRLLVGDGDPANALSDLPAVTEAIRALRAPPPIPVVSTEVELDSRARQVVSTLTRELERSDAILVGPQRLKALRKALVELLTEVLEEHLPATLQRLWWELAANLTPAPWQLTRRPAFDVRRKGQRTTVTVRAGPNGPLAAYVLNHGQAHVLGLAWFIVRLLLQGRFRYAFAVLDDPAQGLDDRAFADLCGLCRRLVGLLSAPERPFTWVMLLDDEVRARRAAESTGAKLMALPWGETHLRASLR